MRGKNFFSPPLSSPPPNCLPFLSCRGPSLDWSLVKFLCHFLLLPSSTLAPALRSPLLSSRRRTRHPPSQLADFGKDVRGQGHTSRSRLSRRIPALAFSTASAPSPLPATPKNRTVKQLSSLQVAQLFFPGCRESKAARAKKKPSSSLANFAADGRGPVHAGGGERGGCGMPALSVWVVGGRGAVVWSCRSFGSPGYTGERSASARAGIDAVLRTPVA